jgi:hypothetical protein
MTYINIRAVKGIGIIMSSKAKIVKYIRIFVFGFIGFSINFHTILNMLLTVGYNRPERFKEPSRTSSSSEVRVRFIPLLDVNENATSTIYSRGC